MIYKYYTADLITIDGSQPDYGCLNVKVYWWWSPVKASISMTNTINKDLGDHYKFKNFRRIK